MEKRAYAGRSSLRFRKGILLVLCLLLVCGTQTGQLYTQGSPVVDWNTTTTYTVKPSSGYNYNYTSFGLYNGTYYNLYYPLNYPDNLPLIIQFGGYSGISNGLSNLMEDSPLCGYLVSRGYAVLEFGYDTGGTIPQASQTCLEVLKGTILPWVENDSFPLTIDKSAIGLCGHSAGASTILGLVSSNVASSVALTPYYLSTSLVPQVQNLVPTLILTGQADNLVPYNDNGTAYYNGLVASKAILDIAGGDHNLGVGIFDFNTDGTAATLKYVTAWFDATLKSNSTAASLFTSSYLAGDPGINIYQLDITTLSPSPSGDGNIWGVKSNNDAAITFGLIVVTAIAVVAVGLFVYYKKTQRQLVKNL
jgi:acetyl esterase/lipase